MAELYSISTMPCVRIPELVLKENPGKAKDTCNQRAKKAETEACQVHLWGSLISQPGSLGEPKTTKAQKEVDHGRRKTAEVI